LEGTRTDKQDVAKLGTGLGNHCGKVSQSGFTLQHYNSYDFSSDSFQLSLYEGTGILENIENTTFQKL